MSGDSGHDCVQLFVSKVKVKSVILAPLVATNGIARLSHPKLTYTDTILLYYEL